MIEIADLSASYGKLQALNDVNLSVEAGKLMFVVGPNGAGKSTLLKCIAGLLRPRAGTIRFDGKDIVGSQPERLCRNGLALVPEGRHIFGSLSVEENLLLAAMHRSNREAVREDIEQATQLFPILKKRFKGAAGYLSGGEQQQLAIARAILLKPRVMMIDEPSLGLAPLVVDQVYEALHALKRSGLTLLIVEQSTARVLDLADRIAVLRNGKIVLNQPREAISDGTALENAYFGYHGDHAMLATF